MTIENRNGSGVGISPEYVRDWTIEEGIREIVQNNIDVRKEFDCEGYVLHEDGYGVAKDDGPGLEMRHLVMGVSEKAEGSIGQFGEGLKLALLVFAREGREIEIRAKGKRIWPEIVYDDFYETEMIHIQIEDLPAHVASNLKGTKIKFEATEEEVEEGKSYFLNYYKRSASEFDWVVKDFISKPGGNIWVNDSLVGEIEGAEFSYHLGENAKESVNRDRMNVDTEKLKEILAEEIGECNSLTMMKELLKIVRGNEECFELFLPMSVWETDRDNWSTWKRACTMVFGERALLSGDLDAQANYKGFEIIEPRTWRWTNFLERVCGMVKTHDFLREEKMRVAEIAQKDLPKKYRLNLKKAQNVIGNYYKKVGRTKVVEEFGNAGGADVNGMYDAEKDIIYIKYEKLDDLEGTIRILLHEAVHKYTGTADCSAEFESALCSVAAGFLMELGNH